MALEIKNLHVARDGKEILRGVNLCIEKGEVHALMGPNGSGKTTLSYALMGHPRYQITRGKIILNGNDITKMNSDERAREGLFLSFQNPIEVPGITLSNFLRQSYNSLHEKKLSLLEFKKLLEDKARELGIRTEFLARYLNEGFSGGEKKKAEILQMLVLNPSAIILDETDSGLDIDSLNVVANGISNFLSPEKIVLIITHYKRIFDRVKPDKVSIMFDGRVVSEGGKELIDKLEEKGYDWVKG